MLKAVFNRCTKTAKRTYCRVGHDDHDVGVTREAINISREHRVADLHAAEVCRHLTATHLELLYYVTYFLKAVSIWVFTADLMGHNLQIMTNNKKINEN